MISMTADGILKLVGEVRLPGLFELRFGEGYIKKERAVRFAHGCCEEVAYLRSHIKGDLPDEGAHSINRALLVDKLCHILFEKEEKETNPYRHMRYCNSFSEFFDGHVDKFKALIPSLFKGCEHAILLKPDLFKSPIMEGILKIYQEVVNSRDEMYTWIVICERMGVLLYIFRDYLKKYIYDACSVDVIIALIECVQPNIEVREEELLGETLH